MSVRHQFRDPLMPTYVLMREHLDKGGMIRVFEELLGVRYRNPQRPAPAQ